MVIERLTRATYEQNNQDFAECENYWEVIEDEMVKKITHSNYETLKITRPDEDVSFLKWANIDTALEAGAVIELTMMFIRKKTNMKKCPLCGRSIPDGTEALSRRDNITDICSVCAQNEAMDEWEGIRR